MTTGAGLYISPVEQNPIRQNQAIQQLIEGRSNAVGSVTLTHDASATSTLVAAPTCGPNSIVDLVPTSAATAALRATTYVKVADVSPGQFYATHAATSTAGLTFWFFCLG